MSEDLIRREDAIEVVCEIVPIRDDAVEIADAIRAIPSADLNTEFAEWARHWFKDFTDRPQGEWIEHPQYGTIQCDQCTVVYNRALYPKNFCPYCGAKMKGADDE